MVKIRFRTLCVSIVLALTCSLSHADSYSNLFLFGDSLTDSGAFGGVTVAEMYTLPAVPLPNGAKWTIDNAPTHGELLGNKLGLTVTPNNLSIAGTLNGNNYAQGGATSANTTGNFGPTINALQIGTIDVTDLPGQISSHLAARNGKADSNALYFIWTGGNDIPKAAQAGQAAYTAAYTSAITGGQTAVQAAAAGNNASNTAAQAAIISAATAQLTQIGTLKAAGANYIMAPNLPDFSATPAAYMAAIKSYFETKIGTAVMDMSDDNQIAFFNAVVVSWAHLSSTDTNTATKKANAESAAINAAVAQLGNGTTSADLSNFLTNTKSSLSNLSSLFNLTVNAGLANTGANVIRANTALLFNELLANPTQFGITNTTGTACVPPVSALTCTTGPNTPFATSQTYVFADDRHPSNQVQSMLADYYYSLIQAPYFADAAGQVAASAQNFTTQALRTQYKQMHSNNTAINSVVAFVIDGELSQEINKKNKLKSVYNLLAGMSYQVSPTLVAGVAYTESKQKADLSNMGQVKNHYQALSASLGFKHDAIWAHGDLTIGKGNLTTTRSVVIGPLTRQEKASGRAIQMSLNVEGGYKLNLGNITTGPVVGMNLGHTDVGALIEDGNNSSAMRFEKQKRKSQIISVGWQVQANLAKLQPYAEASLSNQMKKDAPMIRSGLITTPSDFVMSGTKPDSSWIAWKAGATTNLRKSIKIFAEVGGTNGRTNANTTSINIGLSAGF